MAFERFRPTSHFIAPHSWSNDPCGAVYVPETKEYLVCYQWNPGTTEGGNCAWGMAKSKDMVTWEDCSPALRNGDSYDSLGVFSGSIVSRLVDGDRVLYLFYTSVSALPIHWSKPYLKGCESQSVAVSRDFGRSWQRSPDNPLIKEPPKGSASTGWRDPFVSQWPSLSRLLGVDQNVNYMMLSSGERGHGSELHIYMSNGLLGGWDYLASILNVESGSAISEASVIRFGVNFECASFFTIGNTDYILVGVEEGEGSTQHNGHLLLWIAGSLTLQDDKPHFNISSHGTLDHGILYASHIFRDAENRLLQLGWADEAVDDQVVNDQGWAGCLAHPRELFELSRPLDDGVIGPECAIDQAGGRKTTLGIRPAPQVVGLRQGQSMSRLEDFQGMHATNYEVEATFSNLSGDEKFTFNVRESSDGLEVTKIVFDIKNECITVERSQSSLLNLGTKAPDTGCLRFIPGEDLRVRFFVDVSVIEIFANDRFAMTSRIYPSLETSVRASYDLGGYDSRNVHFQCWESLKKAWPNRGSGHKTLMQQHLQENLKHQSDQIVIHELVTETGLSAAA